MQVQDSQHGRAVTQHSSHTAPQSYCPLSHGCSAPPLASPMAPHARNFVLKLSRSTPPTSKPQSRRAAPRWSHCRQTKQARLDLPGRGRKNAINMPKAWLTNK